MCVPRTIRSSHRPVVVLPAVDRNGLPDLPGLHHPLHCEEGQVVSRGMSSADTDLVTLRDLDDLVGLAQARAKRLLAVDVASCFRCGADLLKVVVGVPGAEDHDVEGFLVKHVGEGEVVASGTSVAHLLREILGVGIHVADDIHVGQAAEGRVKSVQPQHGLRGVLDDSDSPCSRHQSGPPILRPPSIM